MIKTESQITELVAEKAKVTDDQPTDIMAIMGYAKYFLEHLEYLLLQQINPVAKAGFFGVLFDKAPTYEEIVSGTTSLSPFIALNRVFMQKNNDNNSLAGAVGFEPTIHGTKSRCLTTWLRPIRFKFFLRVF